MKNVIRREYIICGSCKLKFDRTKEFKHCSNCFACSGCEVYYCPGCDNEIIITPVKPMNGSQKEGEKNKK
jgi:hypothetical protein